MYFQMNHRLYLFCKRPWLNIVHETGVSGFCLVKLNLSWAGPGDLVIKCIFESGSESRQAVVLIWIQDLIWVISTKVVTPLLIRPSRREASTGGLVVDLPSFLTSFLPSFLTD